ncbi:Bug family tripartite tricarboxylate transporter substrate binding protein [Muricoccus radiodurans]|uniref:Bug family tripartite tricarboxylate transporter substrate binding protein n=1 Tax=Muricoccus radiodurans TaxID=2231721 RepID=UPI003CF74E91
MTITRRAALLATGGLLAAPAVRAQGFPARNVTLIVGAPPGGTADALGRLVARGLSEEWGGATVVVDNRGTAGGQLAAETVARAAPDGHVLLLANTNVLAINHALSPRQPYDTMRDFAFVGPVANWPLVLAVRPDLGISSPGELIARAKAQPGRLNAASAGNGTAMHLAVAMLNRLAGTEITHVPYRGSGPAMNDMLAGQGVQMIFEPTATLLGPIQSGALRGIAVAGARRAAALPELPTLSEAGLTGFLVTQYHGVVAPAATPVPLVASINAALNRAMGRAEIRERLLALGAEPMSATPGEFAAFVREEIPRWAEIVRLSGAQND